MALLVLLPLNLHADIDESAYEAGGSLRTEVERRRLRDELRREIDAELRRAEAAAAAFEERRALESARAAARPFPERLTERECTRCHGAEHYMLKRHSWLYWRLVVARMVWMNDAPIPFDAQAVIANHLAYAYPATGEDQAVEYGVPLAILTLLAGFVWGCRWFWQGRRSR